MIRLLLSAALAATPFPVVADGGPLPPTPALTAPTASADYRRTHRYRPGLAAARSVGATGTEDRTVGQIDLGKWTKAKLIRMPGRADDEAFSSVAGAGDVNGDGVDDWIVGRPLAAPGGLFVTGAAYVLYGSAETPLDEPVLPPPVGQGFTIVSSSINGRLGEVVGPAGDVDKDGYDDVIVVQGTGAQDGRGNIFVIRGGKTPVDVDVDKLTTAQGVKLVGWQRPDGWGYTIAGGFDVNGDGYGDVAVGSPASAGDPGNFAGNVAVVFGRKTRSSPSLDVTKMTASDGFLVLGDDADDRVGWALAGGSDVDGNGRADLLIGVPGHGPSGAKFGAVRVLKRVPPTATVTESDLPGIVGEQVGQQIGWSVGAGGDVNRDGYDDVVIGGATAVVDGVEGVGIAYVVYGHRRFGSLGLNRLKAAQGYRLIGEMENDVVGRSVAVIGDLNADGVDDVALSSPFASSNGDELNGTVYVVYGRTGRATMDVDLSRLDATTGLYIDGANDGDAVASALQAAGDLDGDGFDDMVIAAASADSGALDDCGIVYLVRGRASHPIRRIGTAGRDVMPGSSGDDLLDGREGKDLISAGAGDDVIIGGAGADVLAGGTGSDTYRFLSVEDSPAPLLPGGTCTECDRILNFTAGNDRIALSAIDADTGKPGKQTFAFVGSNVAAAGTGKIWYVPNKKSGAANNYSDLYADAGGGILRVRVFGAKAFTAGNFR